jgi:tetratricopeptide (TPR) repeat protein
MRLGALSAPGKASTTRDLDAYNAYLKGRFYYNKGAPPDLQQALQHFDEATKHDPSYAVAYAAIADTYEQLAGYDGNAAERMPKARAAAVKALALDESVAEAHMALGVVMAFYEWDFSNAEAAFKRALALNPNSEVVRDWYGWYLLWFRRWDDAVAELRKAVDLDPLSVIMRSDLGWALLHGARWDEGMSEAHKILGLDPGNGQAQGILGFAYLGKGIYSDALASFEKEVEVSGREPVVLQGLAVACSLSGDTTRALKLLDEIKSQPKSKPGDAWHTAWVYRALATRDHRYDDQFFSWLERAYQEHDFNLVWTSAARLYPTSLPTDPRWVAFRKRLGLPP